MRRRFSTGALTAAENDEAFWLGGGVPLGFQYSSNTNTGAALSAPFHHSEIAACISRRELRATVQRKRFERRIGGWRRWRRRWSIIV
eukprot:COSAG01_NODE_60432_length_294_cov_128.107692_1_plen_86_part_10